MSSHRSPGHAMSEAGPGAVGMTIIQHSFWLFDTDENARAAEATFNQLRDLPDAPATFISVDVCEIVGRA